MENTSYCSFKEKLCFALGDASANIAWRGVAAFLTIFYTDVFGLTPASVGLLMLICRSSDGVSDVAMGMIGDRTKSKYGHFRPWILWTAIPLGVILSLLFTAPDWSYEMKLVYAYTTYILFTLIYTANNIPYGALMAMMTPSENERTSLGSFRMMGAFTGGMLVQGSLLALVAYFGNVNPTIDLEQKAETEYVVTVTSPEDVKNAKISTQHGLFGSVAKFQMVGDTAAPTLGKSFEMKAGEKYTFTITGESDLTKDNISLINQSTGYSNSMYIMSAILALCMFLTFWGTRERVAPDEKQEDNLLQDLKDLVKNKPWFILLVVGLGFNIYNNLKTGIIAIYFTHYVGNAALAGIYFVALMLISIVAAMITPSLSKKFGKKNVFIGSMIATSIVNSMLYFFGPTQILMIFAVGITSELFAAILPTLFFGMLGDAADYGEKVFGRRATGLVYSAGSFATKFGGGIAGAIIGAVLGLYGYDGQDSSAIQNAVPGIINLMSWIPAVICLAFTFVMSFYPITSVAEATAPTIKDDSTDLTINNENK